MYEKKRLLSQLLIHGGAILDFEVGGGEVPPVFRVKFSTGGGVGNSEVYWIAALHLGSERRKSGVSQSDICIHLEVGCLSESRWFLSRAPDLLELPLSERERGGALTERERERERGREREREREALVVARYVAAAAAAAEPRTGITKREKHAWDGDHHRRD